LVNVDLNLVTLMAVQSLHRGWIWLDHEEIANWKRIEDLGEEEEKRLWWMRSTVSLEWNESGNLRGMHRRERNRVWTDVMRMSLSRVGEWSGEVVCMYFI
jgi:hypothetical protein